MRGPAAALALIAGALALAPAAHAAPRLEPVPGRYDVPMYLTAPQGESERLFIVERDGRVRLVANGVPLSTPFIDLRGEVTRDGERGLLSMAFPPDYAASGLVYTFLTGPGGELQVREHRRSTNRNRAQAASRVVWSEPHPGVMHNGGQIQFGPDGLLWISTGDGGPQGDPDNNAQELDTQLGKLLRIDPRPGATRGFTVPADNPFAGGDTIDDAIWATGLRNPFRFSFDRQTGDLTIGDVGYRTREEINFVRRADGLGRGADFGWRCYEGAVRTPEVEPSCEPRGPYLPPVFDYPRSEGRSVTGGVVVRDPGLPTLFGRYLYADYMIDGLRTLALEAPGADPRPAVLSVPQPTDVVALGEDGCGRVYVVSIAGPVNRLADADADVAPCGGPPADDSVVTPATGPTGPTGGTGGGSQSVPDTRAPALRVGVAGRRGLAVRRSLRVAIRTDEAARVRVTGRLRGVASFRTTRRRVPAGRRTVVALRVSRASARKLRRTLRGKRVIAALSIRARDAAGNSRRTTRRIVIPRR